MDTLAVTSIFRITSRNQRVLDVIWIGNYFMRSWDVDNNLRVRLLCDTGEDVFINSGVNDRSPILPIKVGDVSSAPNKTDLYRHP